MSSGISYSSKQKSTRHEFDGAFPPSMTTKQAVKEASRDPVAWVQVLAPLLFTGALLAIWGHLQYTKTRVDQNSVDLNHSVQAFTSESNRTVKVATDAVVKAVEPQIQTLAGQNIESKSNRAHIETQVNDLKADLAEMKKSQDEMVKAFNGTKASFNEAKSILKQILEKQVQK